MSDQAIEVTKMMKVGHHGLEICIIPEGQPLPKNGKLGKIEYLHLHRPFKGGATDFLIPTIHLPDLTKAFDFLKGADEESIPSVAVGVNAFTTLLYSDKLYNHKETKMHPQLVRRFDNGTMKMDLFNAEVEPLLKYVHSFMADLNVIDNATT